jgi:hypothetical protein
MFLQEQIKVIIITIMSFFLSYDRHSSTSVNSAGEADRPKNAKTNSQSVGVARLAEPGVGMARLAVGRRTGHCLRGRERCHVLQDAVFAVHARAREGQDTGGGGHGARLATVLARASLAHALQSQTLHAQICACLESDLSTFKMLGSEFMHFICFYWTQGIGIYSSQFSTQVV